jgi:Ca2+-binding EF-hand superfamily protein
MTTKSPINFFDLCDEDHDGFITVNELKMVFNQKRFDEKFIESFVSLFDENHDKKISKDEYKAVVDKVEKKDKELSIWKDIFDMFDLDHDGFISREEFQTVTKQMQNKTSIHLSMDDYEKFIKSYDSNSDGKIDYGEFMEFLKGCPLK